MQKKARTCLPKVPHNTCILYNHAVQPFLIKFPHKGGKLVHFALPGQSIDGQIDFYAIQVGGPDCCLQLFLCEIIGIGSGAEFLSCQIDRVRACVQRSAESVHTARRCQQLNFMHTNSFQLCIRKESAVNHACALPITDFIFPSSAASRRYGLFARVRAHPRLLLSSSRVFISVSRRMIFFALSSRSFSACRSFFSVLSSFICEVTSSCLTS